MKKNTFVKISCLLSVIILLNIIWITEKGGIPLKRTLLSVAIALVLGIVIYILECKVKITFREILGKDVFRKKSYTQEGLKIFDILALLAVFALSVFVRYKAFYFESSDYEIFWDKWIDQFRSIGWHSLGCNIGNYPPLYTEILIALSMTSMSKMLISKLIPMVFDYVLGIVGVMMYGELKKEHTVHGKIIVFASIILNPIVVLNSAAWGQCDVIYSSFVLMSVLILVKIINGKKVQSELSLVFFSIAFCFKLQAILFFPLLLFYMIIQKKKDVKITQLVWIPIIYIVTSLPMLFAGRATSDVLLAYAKQAGQYSSFLNMRYHNFYDLIGANVFDIKDAYYALGMTLAVAIVGLIYYFCWKKDVKITSEKIVLLGAFTVATLAFFLPSMHERYAFVAEMLILILALICKKYIIPALLTFVCTIITYGDYLSADALDITLEWKIVIALVRLSVIAYMTYVIFISKDEKQKQNSECPEN